MFTMDLVTIRGNGGDDEGRFCLHHVSVVSHSWVLLKQLVYGGANDDSHGLDRLRLRGPHPLISNGVLLTSHEIGKSMAQRPQDEGNPQCQMLESRARQSVFR